MALITTEETTRSKRDTRRTQVVMRLFDALLDNDRDRVLSFFREDSIFLTADGAVQTGLEAIWAALGGQGSEPVERELLELQADSQGRVRARWAERQLIGGNMRERYAEGILSVEGCKVCHWQHDPTI